MTAEDARNEEWEEDARIERAISRQSRLRWDDGHPGECGPNCLQCADERSARDEDDL